MKKVMTMIVMLGLAGAAYAGEDAMRSLIKAAPQGAETPGAAVAAPAEVPLTSNEDKRQAFDLMEKLFNSPKAAYVQMKLLAATIAPEAVSTEHRLNYIAATGKKGELERNTGYLHIGSSNTPGHAGLVPSGYNVTCVAPYPVSGYVRGEAARALELHTQATDASHPSGAHIAQVDIKQVNYGGKEYVILRSVIDAKVTAYAVVDEGGIRKEKRSFFNTWQNGSSGGNGFFRTW